LADNAHQSYQTKGKAEFHGHVARKKKIMSYL